MEAVKLTRREREKIRHRGEVLEAALDLFSEKGFHNVSMHEIARRAEFAIGTLYSLFNNKEDLYKAIILDQSKRFHEALNEALDQGEKECDRLENYVRAKGQVFADNIKVVRLYFAETRGASFNIKAGLDAEIQEAYEQTLEHLAAIFESGIEKGIFASVGSYDLALALDSLTNTAMMLWMRNPEKHPYQQKMQPMMKILFDRTRID